MNTLQSFIAGRWIGQQPAQALGSADLALQGVIQLTRADPCAFLEEGTG